MSLSWFDFIHPVKGQRVSQAACQSQEPELLVWTSCFDIWAWVWVTRDILDQEPGSWFCHGRRPSEPGFLWKDIWCKSWATSTVSTKHMHSAEGLLSRVGLPGTNECTSKLRAYWTWTLVWQTTWHPLVQVWAMVLPAQCVQVANISSFLFLLQQRHFLGILQWFLEG